MADVRNLTIGVAFKVNAGALQEADENISRLVQSAKALDAAGGAGFLKVADGAKKSAVATQDLADDAKKAESSLKDVATSASKLGSDTADGAKKAANGVKDIATAGQKAGNDVSAGADKATAALNKSSSAAETARNALREAGSYGKKIGSDIDSGTSKAISGLTRLIDKAKTATSALGRIGKKIGKIPETLGVGYNGEHEGKITGAIKESAAMFAPGFLIANAVMSAADKAKEEIVEGYNYTKEQSGMGGTWKTLVDGTRSEGVSAAQAGTSDSIVKTINEQSRDTGRGLELVNEASQQTYHATDDAGRTSHLVQSELRIADAMGLSDVNAKNFAITGVGHALDLGKVSAGNMNVMSLYAPAVKYAVARVMAAKENHEDISKVTEEEQKKYAQQLGGKKGLLEQGKVSSQDLEMAINYLGDTKFKDAAKNAMQTLPGMTRSIENGMPRIMSSFENGLFKPMSGRAKSVMQKVSEWFTSDKSEQEAAAFGKNLSKVTSYLYDNGKKIATAMTPFAKGFGKGLIDGLHDLQSAWSKVSKTFDGVGKTIDGFVSKYQTLNKLFGTEKTKNGTVNHGAATLGKVGEFAGVATVMTLAAKLATKLPAIGGPIQKAIDVVGKIPVVGSTLEHVPGVKSLFSGKNPFSGNDKEHVPGVKSLFSGKNPFSENDKAIVANTAAVNANTRALGGKPTSGDGLDGGDQGNSRASKKLSKYDKYAKEYEDAVNKHGSDSWQAKHASNKLSKYESKAKAELDKAESAYSKYAGDVERYGTKKVEKQDLKASQLRDDYKSISDRITGTEGKAYTKSELKELQQMEKGSGVLGKVSGLFGKSGGSKVKALAEAGELAGDAEQVAGKTGILGKIGGGLVHGLGGLGKGVDKIFSSKAATSLFGDGGEALAESSGLLGKVGGLFKGAGILGVVSNAVSLGSAFMQKPGKTRDKAIGNSVGSMAGGAIGGALGSFLGPLGTIAGGMAGGWLGGKAGSWIGGHAKTIGHDVSAAGKTVGKWVSGVPKDLSGLGKNVSKGLSSAGKTASKTFDSIGKGAVRGFNVARSNADKAAGSLKKFPVIGKAAAHQIEAISHPIKTMQKDLKTAKSVASGVGKGFKTIGNGAKSAFSAVVKSVTSGLNKAKSSAEKGAKNIGKSITSGLKSVGKGAGSLFNGFVRSVKSGLNKAVSAAKSGATKLSSTLKNGIKLDSVGKSAFSKLDSAASSGMSKVNSTTKSGAEKMSNSVKSGMDKVNSVMKTAFSTLVSTANSATSKVASSLAKIGSSADSAASRVRSLQSAINSLKSKTVTITANVEGKGASKLATGTPGAKRAFSKFIPAYAGGTTNGGHAGGLAKVNDAKGSTWRESFMLPNGLVGLFPKKRDLVVPLPAGTQVLDAVSTHQKFGAAYATGTSGAVEAFSKIPGQKSAGVTIQIQPQFNITAGSGQNLDDLQKQVMEIIKPFLDMMAKSLQVKLV